MTRILIFALGIGALWTGCTDDGSSEKNSQVEIDVDKDGVPNDSDNCPDVANPGQGDSNQNGFGDACESKAFAPMFTVRKSDTENMAAGQTLFSVVGGEDVFFDPGWEQFGFLASLPRHHLSLTAPPLRWIGYLLISMARNSIWWMCCPMGIFWPFAAPTAVKSWWKLIR